MALVLGLVQVANRLKLDEPENVGYVRMAYGASLVVQLFIMGYTYSRIQKKKDATKLVYSEPASYGNSEPTQIETTVKEYDESQLKSAMTQWLLSLAIIIGMHTYWGYVRPLTLQVVLGIKTVLSTPIAQIHVLGKEATGNLDRPFKVPNPFGMAEQPKASEKEEKAKAKKELKKKINRYD
jgi:hypothetical protein